MHYIYLTINDINNKKYIGQRSCKPDIESILNDKYLGSGKLITYAVNKYGPNCFFKIILAICKTQKEADKLEAFYFNKYDVLNNQHEFYNRALPGQIYRHEKHPEYISKVMKEYYADEDNLKNLNKKINEKRKTKGLKPIEYLPRHIKRTIKLCNILVKNYYIQKKKYKLNKTKLDVEIETLNTIGIILRKSRHRMRPRFMSDRHRSLYFKYRKYYHGKIIFSKDRLLNMSTSAKNRANKRENRLINSRLRYNNSDHPINKYMIDNNIIKRTLPKGIQSKIDKVISGKYSSETKKNDIYSEIMTHLADIA